MSSTARKVLDEAMRLPVEPRRIVAEALLHSVSEESERDEILRRIAQAQRGEVRPEPWSEVRAKLHQALDR